MKSKRAPSLEKAIEHLQVKEPVKVVDTCRKLLKKDPKNYDILHLMGIGYRLQKNYKAAIEYYRKALKVRPEGSATLFCNIASACLDTRLETTFTAARYSERAKKLAPDLVETYEVGADIDLRVGDAPAAEASLKRALELSPNNPRLLRKLAKAYKETEQFDAALATIETAMNVSPGDYSILEEHADIREKRGETEEALEAFEYLKTQPECDPLLVDQRIIGMLSTHGRSEDVEKRALMLMERNPRSISPHLTLIRLGKHPEGVERGAEIVKELREGRKFRLLEDYAIADGYDKEKNYDRSFEYYKSGNAKKRERERKRYKNISVTHEHHDNIRSVFEGKVHELMGPADNLDDYPTPIFVLGMPRSGTSLTEQLLGMHSQIHPAGELGFLPRLVKYGNMEYLNHPRQQEKAHWDWVGRTYLANIRAISDNAPFVIDKMPHNFENTGFIRKLFPHAVVIHTFRDPISNCLSIYKANFGGWHPYGQDLRLLGQYYFEYQKLMRFWEDRFGDGIYQSRYENLVDDMRTAVTEMLDRCGLDWEDEIEDFHSVDRIVRTASNDQVRQPIYKSSKKSWTKYEKHLQPLIEVLKETKVITDADLA